jgi:hypothetical protein
MNAYLVLRFLHLLGVLGFVAAHGATITVTFKLRSERDPARVKTMLELSRATRHVMYASFTLLLGAGVTMGFVAQLWASGWIWASLILLLLLFAAAFPLALPYFGAIRRAVAAEPIDPDALARLLKSPRGLVLAWVETLGILAILGLMVFKPF